MRRRKKGLLFQGNTADQENSNNLLIPIEKIVELETLAAFRFSAKWSGSYFSPSVINGIEPPLLGPSRPVFI